MKHPWQPSPTVTKHKKQHFTARHCLLMRPPRTPAHGKDTLQPCRTVTRHEKQHFNAQHWLLMHPSRTQAHVKHTWKTSRTASIHKKQHFTASHWLLMHTSHTQVHVKHTWQPSTAVTWHKKTAFHRTALATYTPLFHQRTSNILANHQQQSHGMRKSISPAKLAACASLPHLSMPAAIKKSHTT